MRNTKERLIEVTTQIDLCLTAVKSLDNKQQELRNSQAVTNDLLYELTLERDKLLKLLKQQQKLKENTK